MPARPRSVPDYSPFTRALETRVLRHVQRQAALRPGERVVVAVSGGPDSTALAIVLANLRERLPLDLSVAHFDHRLRSREEATADRTFAERLAKTLGLPFSAGEGDVAARARRRRESVEEAARKMRYRFLGDEAKREGATAVAIGHTVDDRAETVLLHLLRGSGLDGLAAMGPRDPWPFGRGPDVARPLLGISRRDTERYCREAGVEPRRDATNDLLIATRNRVRHELLPVMRSFNPRIAEALARLADAAARDAAYLDAAADGAWRRVAAVTEGAVAFEHAAFASLGPAVQVRLLRRASAALGAEAASAQQLEAVLEGLGHGRSRTSLPGGLVASVDRRQIRVARAGDS